ncbi:unnamed protein product, partial [marine sediment metagenome]
ISLGSCDFCYTVKIIFYDVVDGGFLRCARRFSAVKDCGLG